MSLNLYWKPKGQGERLDKDLKFKLEEAGWRFPKTIDSYDADYLRGLADCNIKGAKELVDAIEKYDEVYVTLEG